MPPNDNRYVPRPPEPRTGPGGWSAPIRLQWDELFAHPTDAPQTSVPDGWDLTGPVPAIATGQTWIRSARSMWLVQCNLDIRSADGRRRLPPCQGTWWQPIC